ncbi:hypothetical protein D3C87_1487170 [compost metagenome]
MSRSRADESGSWRIGIMPWGDGAVIVPVLTVQVWIISIGTAEKPSRKAQRRHRVHHRVAAHTEVEAGTITIQAGIPHRRAIPVGITKPVRVRTAVVDHLIAGWCGVAVTALRCIFLRSLAKLLHRLWILFQLVLVSSEFFLVLCFNLVVNGCEIVADIRRAVFKTLTEPCYKVGVIVQERQYVRHFFQCSERLLGIGVQKGDHALE